jgi:hypothetical protein
LILLVEHWSDASKICLERVNRYTADLHVRYLEVPVVRPVLLVTDPSAKNIPQQFRTEFAGQTVLELNCHALVIDAAFREQWANSGNPVAAMLSVLVPAANRLDEVLQAVRVCFAYTSDPEDWVWIFQILENLAKLVPDERNELYTRLREEPNMVSVVDLIKADGRIEGKVEGKVEGKAEGAVLVIEKLVADGTLTRPQAVLKIRQLAKDGLLDPTATEEALEQFENGNGHASHN